MNKMTSAALLDSALTKVESASIRAWAQGQRAEWIKIAHKWQILNPKADDTAFAAYILCVAIG